MSILKTVRKHGAAISTELGDLTVGELFRFVTPVHQSCDHEDVYVVVQLSSSYTPIPDKFSGKVPCVNLSKHKLSVVSPERPVHRVDGHLQLH